MMVDMTGFQRYRRPDTGSQPVENVNPDPGLNTRETNIDRLRASVPTNSLTADEPSEARNVMEVADEEFRQNMPNASIITEGNKVVSAQENRDNFMAKNPSDYDAVNFAPPTSVNPGTDGTGPKDAEEGRKQADAGQKRELEAAYAPDLKAGATEETKKLSKERLQEGGIPEEPAGGTDGFVDTKNGDAVPAPKADELPEGAAADDDAPPPEPVIEDPVPESSPPEQTSSEVVDFGGMTKQEMMSYASERFDVKLDQTMKKDAMVQELERLQSGK